MQTKEVLKSIIVSAILTSLAVATAWASETVITPAPLSDRAPIKQAVDGIWPALPKANRPAVDNLASQVPPAKIGHLPVEVRGQIDDVINRFFVAADVTCSIDDKADLFSTNATFFSASYGAEVVGRENLRAGFAERAQAKSKDSPCTEHWTKDYAGRGHHIVSNSIYDRLSDDYVRVYSKGFMVGPDPDELHSKRGHGVVFVRLYVHDFVREDDQWKIHLYFIE